MSQVKLNYQTDLAPESLWLTVTPNPSVRSSLLHVQEVGDFLAREKYYTRREGLDSHLIKYTLSGEGELEYRGQTYSVKPGQLFWIDCQAAQYYHTVPQAGRWHVLWVHFCGPTSAAYYEIFQAANRGRPVATMPPANRIAQTLRALIALYQEPDNSLISDVRASGYLSQLLVEVIRNTGAQQDLSGAPESVQQARSYLAEHFQERITLDDLARRFAVSKFHFQKQFKHYLGCTPNEYLLMQRLNRAKETLRTTDRSIAQIACDVGIQNASHFINLFRKQEGITPAAYRNNWCVD